MGSNTRLMLTTWKPGVWRVWTASNSLLAGVFSVTGGMDRDNPATINIIQSPLLFLSTTPGERSRLSLYFESAEHPRTVTVLVLDWRLSDLTDPIGLRVGRIF